MDVIVKTREEMNRFGSVPASLRRRFSSEVRCSMDEAKRDLVKELAHQGVA